MEKRKWYHYFITEDKKVAVVSLGFLVWIIAVSLGWVVASVAGVWKDGKLAELPATVVHLTLALGATKVTHRIAEANWEKVLGQFFSLFKKEAPKIEKEIEKALQPKKKGKRK